MDLLDQNKRREAPRLSGRERLHSALFRYGGAILALAAGTVVRYWFHPVLGGGGFAIYFIVVVAVAWFGGLGPCVLAQISSLAISMAFFPDPDGENAPWADLVSGLAAFFFVGITTALLSEAMRAAQRRARFRAEEILEERKRLRATLSCIGEGMIATDEAGKIVLTNPVAERLTGWSAEEALGRPLSDVFCISEGSTGEPAESPIGLVLQEGGVVHRNADLVLTTRSGDAVPVDYTAAPIQDARGRTRGIVVVFRDETERRRAEQALRDADRRKDEFLATLAHELRNPLAPIRTGLEVMKLAQDQPEVIEEVRCTMERQTDQMIRLIDDLLDVSRITRGKLLLRRTRTELADVVQNAVDAARPLIDGAGHELTVNVPDEPLVLNADPNRLAQVISNLLNNAAKYTLPGGAICMAAERQESEAIISVKDTGIGIPEPMLERVFDMFTQVDRSNERGDVGLGIGLTLVKSLVEMHGGTVAVRSEGQGRGSEFTIRLPIAAPPPVTETPPREQLAAGQRKRRRILAVDDNQAALSTLSLLLEILGDEVRMAQDGQEAIQAAEDFRPHAVFMDLGMPKMDGFEAARRIREQPWGRDMLLVAVTGWGRDEDRRRTKEVGFDCHLVKPVEPTALKDVLAAVAGSASQA
jgi:PAS domain S-box-containing protein